jgi:hypothetical protein
MEQCGGMRRLWVSGISMAVVACGGSERPARQAPAPSASAAPQDDPGRALTRNECQSLQTWIADACRDPANRDRSSSLDSWCSDFLHRIAAAEEGRGKSWVDVECVPHVNYIDAACFRSTTRVKLLIDCETTVEHH